MTKAKAI